MTRIRDRDGLLVEGALATVLDNALPIELRQGHPAAFRNANPAVASAFDAAMVARLNAQLSAIGELEEALEALKRLTGKLTGAPIRQGIFLGMVTLGDGRTLARVASGHSVSLLNIIDDALPERLQSGDRVYLTGESNAVLDRCDNADAEPGECAVVDRWESHERLVIRHQDREHLVRAAAGLSPETLAPGDLVRLDRESGFAMERIEGGRNVQCAATDEATCLPPEALAGCDGIRDGELRSVIDAIAHPDVATIYAVNKKRPWILLGGPPGTGKTTFARVGAGMLQRATGKDWKVRLLNGAQLFAPYVGQTEERIRSLLREIAEGDGRSVLFVDEVDAIGRTRGEAGNVHSDRFLNTLLAGLEGFDGRLDIVLIAATNRLDILDAAFRSRFSREIHMPRPRLDAARAIFGRHLACEYPYYAASAPAGEARRGMIESALAKLYHPGVSGAEIATLRFRDGKARTVMARDLISGRLIEQICVEARERAFRRHIDGGPRGISADDLDMAVETARERLRNTLTPRNAHSYIMDLPSDIAVVAVDAAPRSRAGATFVRRAA